MSNKECRLLKDLGELEGAIMMSLEMGTLAVMGGLTIEILIALVTGV